MMKSILGATALVAILSVPAVSQDQLSPNGTWVDKWGTSFTFELCGDGTQLCGVLNDIQGDSRTEENLAYVDKEVVKADQIGENAWEGQIALNGGEAKAKVEMVDEDTLTITGCRGILCSSIDYDRAS